MDSKAYTVSAKTLQRKQYPGQIAGQRVIYEHATVTIPGYFVDGLLETWTVLKPLGRYTGPLKGSVTEVVAWAATKDEAIAKAAAKLCPASQAGRN